MAQPPPVLPNLEESLESQLKLLPGQPVKRLKTTYSVIMIVTVMKEKFNRTAPMLPWYQKLSLTMIMNLIRNYQPGWNSLIKPLLCRMWSSRRRMMIPKMGNLKRKYQQHRRRESTERVMGVKPHIIREKLVVEGMRWKS